MWQICYTYNYTLYTPKDSLKRKFIRDSMCSRSVSIVGCVLSEKRRILWSIGNQLGDPWHANNVLSWLIKFYKLSIQIISICAYVEFLQVHWGEGPVYRSHCDNWFIKMISILVIPGIHSCHVSDIILLFIWQTDIAFQISVILKHVHLLYHNYILIHTDEGARACRFWI